MNLNKRNFALAIISVILTIPQTHAAELDNELILGAIPESFNNVGIIRYQDMESDTEIGAEFLRESRSPPGMLDTTGSMSLDSYIAHQLREAGLAISVVALSNEDVPSGMDSAGRNIFRLYVGEESVSTLKQQVSTRRNVDKVDHPHYEIYQDSSASNTVYVSFIDEEMVLVVNDRDDLISATEALLKQEAQQADNWSMLNVVDWDAPVLILRHLQFPMAPPPGSGIVNQENYVAAMWISDTTQPVFELEVATELGLESAEEYVTTVSAVEMLAGPEGVELNLKEGGADTENYTGTLELLHSEMGDHYTDLAFTWLLGIWFAI